MVAVFQPSDSGQVIKYAFHGTSQENGQKIMESQFEIREPKPGQRDKWFGRGVYFYDGDLQAARFWPRNPPKGTATVVIQATISLGKMMDVQTIDVQNALKIVASKLKDKFEPEQLTDATVIDYLADELKYDTVRGTGQINLDGPTLFPGSRLLSLKALIICVKNVDVIQKKTIVYSEKR